MKIIGITGGIGSGKSIVSKIFEIIGIPVYIADDRSKRLMETSSEIRKKLIERFGDTIYINNIPDRKQFAMLIFNDAENLNYVNSIVHPIVFSDFTKWTKKKTTFDLLAIESAILFESGFNEKIDITVNVSAPIDIRLKRVQLRDSVSEKAVMERIKNQISEEERNKKSDFQLINDEKHSLINQIENLINLWKK